MDEIGLFEAMYSARALRRFKPDPVPDEVMTRVLDAAIRAPSGSNQQHWLFVVVKDAESRRKLSAIYHKGSQLMMKFYATRPRLAHMNEAEENRLLKSASYLFENMHEAPVLLLACLKQEGPAAAQNLPPDLAGKMRALQRTTGSSIYPAVQNIILACRALGLGTVLTTLHLLHEDEAKAVVGLPPEVQTYALLPIGYPHDKFGPVKRKPVSEVACLDRYGNPWKG
jgi:nitroreductase